MRRFIAIACLALTLGAGCDQPTDGNEPRDIGAGRGSISLAWSGALNGTAAIGGSATVSSCVFDQSSDGELLGEGAYAESVFLDPDPAYPGARIHYVVTHFQIIPDDGDRIVLSMLFAVVDSSNEDPFTRRGAAATYDTKSEDAWRSDGFPYRYAQVEMLTAPGIIPVSALQLGRSKTTERGASYGHRYVAAPGDARIEVESYVDEHMVKFSGFISGTLTDASGATVTLERSPFEIVAPQLHIRRF
jgi:hypothetical protein